MSAKETAAKNLKGLVLNEHWTVLSDPISKPDMSGGFFSCCYIGTNGENEVFIKAIDIESFFLMYNHDVMEAMQKMSAAYEYEKELLRLCRNKSFSKVAQTLDEGEIRVDGFMFTVPFLVFELADGDIRNVLTPDYSLVNTAWKLKSLRDVAVGIRQLNSIDVSHQDIKPSNMLIFDSQTTKVGDVGRSVCMQELKAPHEKPDRLYVGDGSYAPFEAYYGYHQKDWKERNFSTDNFQLGSLISFYFTYSTITSLVFNQLDEDFHPQKWTGTYIEVLPYLTHTFYDVIQEVGDHINDEEMRNGVCKMIEYLCHPNLAERGHPKNRKERFTNNFNLTRIVSQIDRLRLKAEYKLKN